MSCCDSQFWKPEIQEEHKLFDYSKLNENGLTTTWEKRKFRKGSIFHYYCLPATCSTCHFRFRGSRRLPSTTDTGLAKKMAFSSNSNKITCGRQAIRIHLNYLSGFSPHFSSFIVKQFHFLKNKLLCPTPDAVLRIAAQLLKLSGLVSFKLLKIKKC